MEIGNPAFNYDKHGQKYSGYRRTEPRIAKYVNEALESAKTVLNVGAGAGSYEPEDRYVVAVEPSSVMRSQRQAHHRVPALIGMADALPFDDHAFDAAMAMLTVHHWPDKRKGLQELRRVAREQVIILTFDPDALDGFWNSRYFPELIEVEKLRFPKIEFIVTSLGGNCRVQPIPVPFDCVDGFQEAFYGRPEAFLEKEMRLFSQSAWGFLPEGAEDKLVKSLSHELASGEWDRKYGHYRTEPYFTGALRLIVATP
ncbi:class I SAM-dependent methyltransferase [Paenibacillus thiaminolyticus]|uniref:Class I SAM-dependent methyltransferase n=1 Tax=Paenibacillus thiaminolyticus TaxID=49283 RepID=A0A3A3GK01_PANTH|nr:class I SAM-dependent methyltransferase [Paenibacillus thiaminolyticus]RJG25177.1 class I SAM-dependent methyltransferase [Paenibacillus thiaminolyticus]